MQTSVTYAIFPRIVNATTAKEAWDTLQTEFQGNTKVRTIKLQNLRREFENLRMKSGESNNDYFSKVTEVVNQMKIYGEDVQEEKVVSKILNTLIEKFDNAINVIESTKDLSKLNVVEMIGLLKAQEERVNNRSESTPEKAFQTSHRGKYKKYEGKDYYKAGVSKELEKSSPSSSGGEKKGRYPSYGTCKRTNHLEKDCRWKGKPQCNFCKLFGHIERQEEAKPSTSPSFRVSR